MKCPYGIYTFTRAAAIFSTAAALATATSLFADNVQSNARTGTRRSDAQSRCTFSDGSTIEFGHETWRTGGYQAVSFRISERMVIPPIDGRLQMPAGSYTFFVLDKDGPPWTLIVSKKTGKLGMPYPGERYDLGRTQMGSDVQAPVKDFTAGCRLIEHGPAFLWMQSGRTVAYVKILAVKGTGEKAEYLIH
jgi:hypothetical protein